MKELGRTQGGDALLVVEDEKAIRNALSIVLASGGYRVLEATTGKEALSMASSHCPRLIVLDMGLPDMDGLEVLDALRAWTLLPVIVLSARDQEASKVEALDRGADDYITKPFSNAELLARVRTALRRPTAEALRMTMDSLQIGGLTMDLKRHTVTVDGQDVHLTPIEYRIVYLLACNAGRVLTHDRLLNALWGPHSTDPQILRVNMANIRRKIEKNPADPQYILTEIGIGYRMAEGEPEP